MTASQPSSLKIGVGILSLLVIIFSALLLSGFGPLFKKHVFTRGLPVVGRPDERVVEYGSWLLNGQTFGDGPWKNSYTSEGLCYVIVEVDGKKRKHICHRVRTVFDRKAMKGSITFD